MTRYLSEAMQPQRWVQAVWPWLVVAVLGIVAAEAVPNYTVSGAGDAAADGVFIATTTHASYLAISGMQVIHRVVAFMRTLSGAPAYISSYPPQLLARRDYMRQ